MSEQEFTDEEKEKIVLETFEKGRYWYDIEKKYHISSDQLSEWRKEYLRKKTKNYGYEEILDKEELEELLEDICIVHLPPMEINMSSEIKSLEFIVSGGPCPSDEYYYVNDGKTRTLEYRRENIWGFKDFVPINEKVIVDSSFDRKVLKLLRYYSKKDYGENMVCDGEGFSLEAILSDGTKIESSGYMSYPIVQYKLERILGAFVSYDIEMMELEEFIKEHDENKEK